MILLARYLNTLGINGVENRIGGKTLKVVAANSKDFQYGRSIEFLF
jgi:hypothetical protein